MTKLSVEELALFGDEPAAVVPPDAPKNDPDYAPPERATRKKKMQVIDQTVPEQPYVSNMKLPSTFNATEIGVPSNMTILQGALHQLPSQSDLAKLLAKALRAAAAALEE